MAIGVMSQRPFNVFSQAVAVWSTGPNFRGSTACRHRQKRLRLVSENGSLGTSESTCPLWNEKTIMRIVNPGMSEKSGSLLFLLFQYFVW